MKAALCRGYGTPDAVRVEEVEKPVPKDDEVLLRVRAAALNPLDWHLKRGKPLVIRLMTGLRTPRDARLGVDVAGEVEAVGKNVTEFTPGDAVFGASRGAFAEYACTSASSLALKPENVTFEQAASVAIAGFTALQGLRDKARLQPGQKVLINGAAGGVGTFTVQIAKSFGAHVTGVCSTRNVEMLHSIGADRVVDYTREDFTQGDERYDLVFDLVGNHSLSACRRVLHPRGTYVGAGALELGGTFDLLTGLIAQVVTSWFASQRIVTFMARRSKDDLGVLAGLMADAKLKPVIDTCYPLSEVPAAIRHLEGKHARGKVVITL